MGGSAVDPEPALWRGRWWLYGAGAATVLWGLGGLLLSAGRTHPLHWLAFFVGGAVLHDGVFAPLIGALLAAGSRLLSAPYRRPVQAAALVSLLVTVVALPVLSGFGRVADTPSRLPLPYGRNLLAVLAVVWAPAVLLVGWRRLHQPPFFAVRPPP